MKVLAIIPARGKSKGIPGKNIRVIDGKPLISYTIEAALASTKLSSIWVSSDDDDILRVASVPGINLHKRADEIAGDASPVSQAVDVVLKEAMAKSGDRYDAIMLLQPTAPIRTGRNIDEAIEELEKHPDANTIISVCAMDDVHPARMYTAEATGLKPYVPEYEQLRRQDIPPAYYRNGSIYLVRTEAFIAHQSLMVKPSYPYIMSAKQLLNLDDMRDLLIAEALIPAWKEGRL